MSKELQFNRIYEETKDFGRTQFVREIQMQINENKKLNQQVKKQKEVIEKAIKMIDDCACYNKEDKECKCGFAAMAMTELRSILNEVIVWD